MVDFMLLFNVIDIFKEYGLVITLFIVFVLISYMLITNSTKRIREQEEKIDSLYKRIDQLVNKFKPDENSELTGKFINYAENANKIQIQLYHLLQNFEADRVAIYEFHNGGKNLAGVEFKKCSNTYEAVALETKPSIKELQNLPLSINPLWSKILATRDDIIIPSYVSLEDNFLKVYLETQNIKAYYSTILQDYDNTPVGFMCVEYYHNAKQLDQDELEEFKEIAIKISVLINIK
jgi:hypothetical protein